MKVKLVSSTFGGTYPKLYLLSLVKAAVAVNIGIQRSQPFMTDRCLKRFTKMPRFYLSKQVSKQVNMRQRESVCAYVDTYTRMHMCMCVCRYVCMYVCMCVRMHVSA